MYKEIFCPVLTPGKKRRRERLPLAEIPAYIKDFDFRHYELLIGQDTWTESYFSLLADYDFWLDLDANNKNNQTVIQNLHDTVPLCIELLEVLAREHGLGEDQLKVYFSGRGGFHIFLPFRLTEPTKPEVVHKRANLFVQRLAERIQTKETSAAYLDLQLYSSKHLIRLPGSRHLFGLSKVPVSREELQLPPRRLELTLAKRHRTAQGALTLDWLVAKQTNEAFSRLVLNTSVQILAMSQAAVLNWNIGFLANNQPEIRCLAWFIDVPRAIAPGQYNNARMFFISWIKTLEVERRIAEDIVEDFAIRLSDAGRVPQTKKKERIAAVRSTINTIYKGNNPQYDFTIPGQCTAYVSSALGKDAIKQYCIGCPKHNPSARPQFAGRKDLAELLSLSISPLALKMYLELAVNGPANSQTALEKRLQKNKVTVQKALEELLNEELAMIELDGNRNIIRASHKLAKSLRVRK